MFSQHKLAVILPTLNEAENLAPLLLRLRAALIETSFPFEIVVVDDDSRDGTQAVAARFAAQDARIRLLVRKGERGLAGAILKGWESTDADILGVMDADLQHPPEAIPQMLAALQAGHDVAIGSRYAAGAVLDGWNPLRKLVSRLSVRLTWPLLPRPLCVQDPLSGFFLVRSDCIRRVAFQSAGFKLLLEILVRGHVRSTIDIPIAFARRRRGRSKAGLRVAWNYGCLLARLYWFKYRLRNLAATPQRPGR